MINKLSRTLLFIGALLFGMLGMIGVFLPVVPTTPFILLSVFLLSKSSDKIYNYILNNSILKSFLNNYLEKKFISTSHCAFTLTFLWMGIIISIFSVELIGIKSLLLLIAICVSIHIVYLNRNYKNRNID